MGQYLCLQWHENEMNIINRTESCVNTRRYSYITHHSAYLLHLKAILYVRVLGHLRIFCTFYTFSFTVKPNINQHFVIGLIFHRIFYIHSQNTFTSSTQKHTHRIYKKEKILILLSLNKKKLFLFILIAYLHADPVNFSF